MAQGSRQAPKGTGGGVGEAVARAKVPLIAGGSALAGAAGGLAVGVRRGRRRRRADLVNAARSVGSLSAQVGQLASELQHGRGGPDGGVHRSPIEVVLEALTARRRRA